MKRILLFTLLLVSLGASADTYTWKSGVSTGNWSTAGNWILTSTGLASTSSTPGSGDAVVFSSAATVTLDFGTPLTIGKLTISSDVYFITGAARVLNVGNSPFSGSVFSISANKTLSIEAQGTYGLTINLPNTFTGSIDGNIILGAGSTSGQLNKITSQTSTTGLVFNTGSSCTVSAKTGSSNFPFSTTGSSGASLNSVQFNSGSKFFQLGGGAAFGSSGGTSFAVFNSGSLYSYQLTTTLNVPSRTFGDLELNSAASNLVFQSSFTVDNLIVKQGSWIVSTISGGSTQATYNFNKDITIYDGASLTFGNTTAGANTTGTIINFSGTTQQITTSGTGTGTVTINAAGTGVNHKTQFNVNNGSSLTINANFDLGNSNADAKRLFTVLNGGSLTIGTGKTFTVGQATLAVNSGGSLTINSTATLSNNYSSAKSVGIAGTFTNNGAVSGQGLINLNGAATQTISGTGSITNLTISNSTANGISYASGTQSISGAFINGGTFTGAGIVMLSGTATTVSGTGTINNLTIANGSGNSTTISSGMQSITGKLLVSSGTLNTGGFLTLKSTSIANTAIVDQVSGAISGNVTVERYIPKGWRAYRDIAPGVYSATNTLFSNWQEGGSYTSGTGIFITGVSGSSQSVDASGLDVTKTGNASAARYLNSFATSSDNWSTIANTKAQILNPYVGYRVLVRGDRNFNLFTGAVSSSGSITDPNSYLMYSDTKIRSTGQLIYGTVIYRTQSNGGVANSIRNDASVYLNSASTSAFSMITNPYVCPVKWGTGTPSGNDNTTVYGNSSNINASYWYLDPTGGGTGFYRAFNAITGSISNTTYTNSDGSTSTGAPASQYIQPGQAVFVQNFVSTNPTVVFSESCKVASSAKTSVFGISKPLSKIYLSLVKADSATVYVRKDAAAIAFADGFTNTSYGPQDAIKFANATDNLSITDKGKNLSIDGRLPATANDVLPISLDNLSGTVYQFKIDASDYSNNGLSPYLVDSYKGTSTLINGSISVDFTVDAKVTSTYTNRFSIAFKPTTLAVNSLVASATFNNKIATISWNTFGEKGASRFEVEKSTDAKNFAKIGQLVAKNTTTATYTSTDNNATAAINYYRIKAISELGTVSYSNVVKLSTFDSKLSTYSLYPNPLKGSKVVNLSLSNVIAGKYNVTITNVLGQKVQEAAFSHSGGSATHAITITNTLAAGTYSVSVRDASNKNVYQSNLSIN